jgi:hypothetical protein
MKKILVFTLYFITIQLAAQPQKCKVEFASINTIGTVWGNNQNLVCFETINGIRYKNWNIGLGISFDGYGSQSTPVFIDLRKKISSNSNFFVYSDIGVNIPWRTSNFPAKHSWNNLDAFVLKNTFYAELGFGLKKAIAPKTFFVASIGYSYKTFSYTEQNVYDWRTPNNYNNYDYDFYYKRIALRLGVEF